MASKERELRFLERFKKCLPSFPDGQIVEQERPDFLISTPTGTLGIEITELFKSTPEGEKPMQAQEGMEDKILRQAHAFYSDVGGRPVVVYVTFEEQLSVTVPAATQLAKWIANCVLNLLTAPLDIVSVENEFDGNMPDELISIRVVKQSFITQPLWATTRAGWEAAAQPAQIQARIDGKNKKISHYSQKCDRAWIIIVASNEVPSQFITPSEEALSHGYKSDFERTFLFDSFSHKVYDLTNGK